MKLKVRNLEGRIDFYGEALAGLGQPLDKRLDPDDGFSIARCQAEGGMGWAFCQWLKGTPGEEIRRQIEFIVDRGMKMQQRRVVPRYRCLHDLWLLHCAIFASGLDQLLALAERVVDASGTKEFEPRNNGELFAAAWCGMLKYWILGDHKKAQQQAAQIWGAYRYDIARAAPKPLVVAWLAGDWKSFVKQQEKDFKNQWERVRRGGPHRVKFILSKSKKEIAVDLDLLGVVGHGWTWAHCGLALLAHRKGIEVATDPLWFPPHALKCVENASS